MITAAQLADLNPGDIVIVRCVVLSDDGDAVNCGDAIKVRTGNKSVLNVTFYAPLDQIVGVERGSGDVPAFPPVTRGFLSRLSDDAQADWAMAEARLDALCGPHGRVVDIAA